MKNEEELKKLVLERPGITNAREGERIYNNFFKHWKRNHKYIFRRFHLDLNAKILDIGCGPGHNLIHFSKDSLGIEVNPAMISVAKSLGLKILPINAERDLRNIPQRFKTIWCTDFLVHMVSPYKFLYDCRKILTKDGFLIIQIPLLSIFNKHISSCHLYAFNKKSLLYLLKMAGYEVIRTSGFIRKLPGWINFILEPFLQIFGTNIWVLAQKQPNPPINFNKLYFPQWFKP